MAYLGKFGPRRVATAGDLPPLLALFGPGPARTALDNRDGTRWTLQSVRECRKLRKVRAKGGPLKGKRQLIAAPPKALLGLFTRPCASPGCTRTVHAELSLGALSRCVVQPGSFRVVRCDKCRARRAARTPEQLAADRKAARAAYDAARYAARKAAQ